jgi:hypothetical protein
MHNLVIQELKLKYLISLQKIDLTSTLFLSIKSLQHFYCTTKLSDYGIQCLSEDWFFTQINEYFSQHIEKEKTKLFALFQN